MIDLAEAIKERVSCLEFARFIGLNPDKAGFVRCPFHNEKTASLKIFNGQSRGWYCFGCGTGGDVISLASKYYGLGFRDTLKRLNDDFNLGLINNGDLRPKINALSALELARRKTVRIKKERQKNALEAEYLATLDKWLKCDRIINDFDPKTAADLFPKEVVEAYNDIPGLREKLNDLEVRRIDASRHSEPTSTTTF